MAVSRVDRFTVNSKRTISSSDIPIDFNIHPDTNDLIRVVNVEAVKRSLRNIIETNLFERFFNPLFGANIRKLLFDNSSPQTSQALQSAIINSIQNNEPRVRIIDIFITDDSDHNRYQVDITFNVVQVTEIQNLQIFLFRVR